ncbi:MAG: hypothetical protein A2Z74_01545 [Chloroflexi bacterium RBG_13_46_9]|nr:MAG: hypothetical protein A2Z74_01545 [Chloroflexi bacterium RBG_13_46_9]
MKPKRIVQIVLITLTVIILAVTPVLAAKPQDVIQRSNGFPSGLHFNLNIHGKDPAVFDCSAMAPGGNSIFVGINDTATIQYVTNTKRTSNFPDGTSAYELYALDPCAVGGDKIAQVYLPTKVQVVDEFGGTTLVDSQGYYVFARILGKPENKQTESGPSTMILEPNIVVQACNDPGTDPNFPDYTDCLWSLGLIVGDNLYLANDETFERFDPAATGGKGKSTARDISPLFTYSGWVYWGEDPDTNDDGSLTDADIPVDWATAYPGANLNGNATLELYEWVLFHPDIDGDNYVDHGDATAAEYWLALAGIDIDTNDDLDISLEEWQAFQVTLGHAEYFDAAWIFDIADLVVTAQGITNNGATLVQFRFYPKNPDLTTYRP